ncbi:MAG: hypothetical protein MJE77_11395 [Proteobacteria bacterium]|nr:hypothetical protein [Pseudomonadota bacterium]
MTTQQPARSEPEYERLKEHAERHRKNKNFEDAYRLFQLALKHRADDPWVWAHLGVTCRKLFRYGDALWCYDQAIRLKSDYAWAYAWRGQIRMIMGDHEGAMADFDRASAIEPEFAESWADFIGYQYHLSNDYERAIAAYEKGERAGLPLATFLKAAAFTELYGWTETTEAAWSAALKAVEAGIKSEQYRVFLKSCYLAMRGDTEQAIHMARDAILGHERPLELLEYLVGESAWMMWLNGHGDPRIAALIDELMDATHPGLIYWRKFLKDDLGKARQKNRSGPDGS